MLALLNEHERPVGVADRESVTVPLKLPLGVTVIFEEPVVPTSTDTAGGLAEIVKSCELSVTVFECVKPAPAALMVKE